MSYAYRIRSRVRNEGFLVTLKYLAYVACYGTYCTVRDAYLDYRYSGKLLNGNLKTPYKSLGANDTYHTDYSVMPLIFENIAINPEDILVDVGCGKGRVINFWLSRKLKNKMYGLELDPVVAAQTASQLHRSKNVTIIPGDAIANLPEEGTVFYFYNPFTAEKVAEFEERMSSIAQGREVTIIYYNPKSLHVFDKDRWNIRRLNFEKDMGIKRWGRFNKYHELAIITSIYTVHQ